MTANPLARLMFLIAVAIALVVIGGISSAYVIFKGTQPLSVMLALVATITYFGMLALPDGRPMGNGFTEARIRLALASTLVMVYLVYLSTVIFWTVPPEATQTLAPDLVDTMTDLIKIVLPFYFGVSGAVEIAKSRAKASESAIGSNVAGQAKDQS